jgi:hypothetical protein
MSGKTSIEFMFPISATFAPMGRLLKRLNSIQDAEVESPVDSILLVPKTTRHGGVYNTTLRGSGEKRSRNEA